MRVGIIRLSSLGDIIVSAAILPYICRLYPNATIDWFIDSTFAKILESSPLISHLYALPLKNAPLSTLPTLMQQLRTIKKYDLLIDMQGLIKSAFVGCVLKKDIFSGFSFFSAKEGIASVFYHHRVKIPYQRNILERNATLILGALAYYTKGELNNATLHSIYQQRARVFGIDKHDKNTIKTMLNSQQLRHLSKILLILEASLESKSYPQSRLIELVRLLLKRANTQIFLLQHTSEKASMIKAHFATNPRVSVIGGLHLGEIKALVGEMDLVIGGDTGLTHLAWAMQKASITLYGNTPAARFKLVGENNYTLSGNANPRYHKNDFSIGKIPPQSISDLAGTILDKSR